MIRPDSHSFRSSCWVAVKSVLKKQFGLKWSREITAILQARRLFPRWRHLLTTTTTRILKGLAFLCQFGLTMVQHVPLPWSTMADPCLCQNSLTMVGHGQSEFNLKVMVDHGQTVVISLPNHSTPWLETVFTLQPWCYHGCTCSIHPLAGKNCYSNLAGIIQF